MRVNPSYRLVHFEECTLSAFSTLFHSTDTFSESGAVYRLITSKIQYKTFVSPGAKSTLHRTFEKQMYVHTAIKLQQQRFHLRTAVLFDGHIRLFCSSLLLLTFSSVSLIDESVALPPALGLTLLWNPSSVNWMVCVRSPFRIEATVRIFSNKRAQRTEIRTRVMLKGKEAWACWVDDMRDCRVTYATRIDASWSWHELPTWNRVNREYWIGLPGLYSIEGHRSEQHLIFRVTLEIEYVPSISWLYLGWLSQANEISFTNVCTNLG